MTVYKAKEPLKQWSECLAWCREQFGGDGEPAFKKTGSLTDYRQYNVVDGLRWWTRQNHFFFRNEKDYMWYCLRWGDQNDR